MGDALVLFGVTGDLGFKKLLPALHDLIVEGPAMWPAQFGVASSEPAAADPHLTAA